MSTHLPGFQSFFMFFCINLYWPNLSHQQHKSYNQFSQLDYKGMRPTAGYFVHTFAKQGVHMNIDVFACSQLYTLTIMQCHLYTSTKNDI